jgi:type VII secretion integral membrane protein EccD
MTIPGQCRVSVRVPSQSASVDVVVPTAVELGELVPYVVEFVGEGSERNECWQLSRADGSLLDESVTLHENGIRDGDELFLGLVAPALEAHRDELSRFVEAASPRADDRWPRRLGAVTCLWSALLGATTLVWPGPSASTLRAVVAAVVAVAATAAAVIANHLDSDPLPTLVAGTTAAVYGAIAGFLLVPGGPAPPNFFLAAAVCSTISAVLLHATTQGDEMFIAIAASSAMAAIAAAFTAIWPVPVQTVGAALTTASLAMLSLAAKLAILMTGLSPRMPSATGLDAADELIAAPFGVARAERGHRTLTGLLAGFSLSAALGTAVVAAGTLGEKPVTGAIFASVTSAVLLVRACQQRGAVRATVVLVMGLISGAAAVTSFASTAPHHAAAVCMTVVILGSGTLLATLTGIGSRLNPVTRRSLDIVEHLLLAAVVPLGCWVSGAFALIRGLNLL